MVCSVTTAGTVCTVWHAESLFAKLLWVKRRSGTGGYVENYRVDKLRAELNQLLKKQSQVLESRSLRSATDTELLEYEIRQEIVHEICNELAHSIAE